MVIRLSRLFGYPVIRFSLRRCCLERSGGSVGSGGQRPSRGQRRAAPRRGPGSQQGLWELHGRGAGSCSRSRGARGAGFGRLKNPKRSQNGTERAGHGARRGWAGSSCGGARCRLCGRVAPGGPVSRAGAAAVTRCWEKPGPVGQELHSAARQGSLGLSSFRGNCSKRRAKAALWVLDVPAAVPAFRPKCPGGSGSKTRLRQLPALQQGGRAGAAAAAPGASGTPGSCGQQAAGTDLPLRAGRCGGAAASCAVLRCAAGVVLVARLRRGRKPQGPGCGGCGALSASSSSPGFVAALPLAREMLQLCRAQARRAHRPRGPSAWGWSSLPPGWAAPRPRGTAWLGTALCLAAAASPAPGLCAQAGLDFAPAVPCGSPASVSSCLGGQNAPKPCWVDVLLAGRHVAVVCSRLRTSLHCRCTGTGRAVSPKS